jgi:hypothetical protein
MATEAKQFRRVPKRPSYRDENTESVRVKLTPDDLARINQELPAN